MCIGPLTLEEKKERSQATLDLALAGEFPRCPPLRARALWVCPIHGCLRIGKTGDTQQMMEDMGLSTIA
jgi:hypothetical protein